MWYTNMRKGETMWKIVDFQADSIGDTMERAVHSMKTMKRNFEKTSSSKKLYTQ